MSGLEESVTYQEIVEKGRVAGVRHVLLRLGQRRFGPVDEATVAALNAIDDVQRLEELTERVYEVDSWQELLPPAGRRRRGGRRSNT